VFAVICVALTTSTEVAAAPPNVTVAPGAKLCPVSVTAEPPAVVPLAGDTPLTVGAGATNVNPLASVALRPSRLVTTTLTLPGACGGVFAVISVALATTTEVAAAPPKATVAPDAKFCPVSFTAVPPVVGPLVGETVFRIGAPNVNPLASVALCPPELVTTTLTQPGACGGVFAVISVALATTTEVAAAPPKATVAPDAKFCPVSFTAVPPVVGPLVGETVFRIGAPNVNPL